MASALGFGVAYYFDAENGGLRRKRLQQSVRNAVGQINTLLAPDVEDPPVVFHPVLPSHRPHGIVPSEAQRMEAVR